MINDDILIKIVRNGLGHKKDNWPDRVIELNARLRELKLGFPGLGNDHLSLVWYDQIKTGDMFIIDEHLLDMGGRKGDEAPILYKKFTDTDAIIEGIGCGIDSKRDPDRIKYRWRDIVELPKLPEKTLVIKVEVKPDLVTGGPGYYYFYKSYRDWRY